MKRLCLFLMVMLCLTGCGKKNDVADYLEEESGIMTGMMEDMLSVQNGGTPELDFLYGMIPHHESAVQMSESYLKYAGNRSEFRQLAQDIIDTQKEEITLMQELSASLEAEGRKDPEKEEAYLADYQGMMEGHAMNHDSQAGDLDTAFAQGMIMHHQMAVDMAQAVLKYAEDERVKELAEGIVALQKEEIAQMQAFLDKNGGTPHQH